MEKTVFQFSVPLSGELTFLVKEGQFVSENEVIAKARVGLEEELDLISPKFLIKQLGKRVKKNELVAQRRTFLGSKKVYSPINGKLVSLSEKGVLKISSFSQFEVKADFSGKIIKISQKKIVVEFPALKFVGDWGIGQKASGFLRVVTIGLEEEDISEICSDVFGKILVVEGKISRAFWFKALSLKVAGIVCRQLPRGGFRKLLLRQYEVVGFPPLMVIGNREKKEKIWDELKKHEGKKVLVKGEKAELVVPL